jgi:predicted ATPase
VRDLFRAFGGDVVRGGADGRRTLVRFESVRAALRAAADLVRARPDPSGFGLAVHAGPAVCLGADWFGPAVDYATGLGTLAHPTQILVSDVAAEQVGDRLPASGALHRLGRYRIQDRTELESVYQLRLPGLPDGFPPLRAGGQLVGVPAEVSSFVGRGTELTHIAARLREARLLTLLGPGGSGKTRLAMRAARAAAVDLCPDGVLFVDLAPVDDPDRLSSVVARWLRLHQQTDVAVLDAIVSHLRERRMLLVLDNCEHLVDAVSEFATAVLHGSPNVRMLTTSRERLAVTGEATWSVPPLILPADGSLAAVVRSEATRLFRDRARAVAPGFDLTEANAADVETICRRLDGLPLAIELAAARTRVLGTAEIVARLDDRFALLGSVTRSGLPRHRTLRAVVDWSYEQLGPAERRLLAALSVFPGSFSLAAAESVGGADTLTRITELVDKSLVQVVPGHDARYRLLETIRAYAAEHLAAEPDAEAAARAAHARFFYELAKRAAPEMHGPDALIWLQRLDEEIENLPRAIGWTVRHDVEGQAGLSWSYLEYWAERGYSRAGESFMRAVLDSLPTHSAGRVPTLCLAAHLATVHGDLDKAESLGERALSLARERQDPCAEGQALLVVVHVAYYQGRYADCLEHLAAFEKVSDASDDWVGARLTILTAMLRLAHGERELARRLVATGLARAQAAGERISTVFGLRESAVIAALDGDHDGAVGLLEGAVALAAEAGDARQVVWCQRALAFVMQRHDDVPSAIRCALEGLRLAVDGHGTQQIAELQLVLATLDRARGDPGGALERLRSPRQATDPRLVGRAGVLTGEIDWLHDRPGPALDALAAASAVGTAADRACARIGAMTVRMDLGRPVTMDDLLDAYERLGPEASYDTRGWYRCLAARVACRLGGDQDHVDEMLVAAVDDGALAFDPLVPVRVAEQVAYLRGDRDPALTARLLVGATTFRERLELPRTPLESRWHAHVAQVGRVADRDYGRAELLEQAHALLAADVSG